MEGRGEDREDRRVGKEVEESCVCRATRGRLEGKAGKDWGEHAGAELGWRVNFKDWSDSGWTQPIKYCLLYWQFGSDSEQLPGCIT
jgi:hypothetical protein